MGARGLLQDAAPLYLRAAAGGPMTGAICGGSPFVWKVVKTRKRLWCFGERKRLTGRWELRAGWERGTVPDDSVGYWDPIWVYRCSGCDKDQRSGGFYYAGHG